MKVRIYWLIYEYQKFNLKINKIGLLSIEIYIKKYLL